MAGKTGEYVQPAYPDKLVEPVDKCGAPEDALSGLFASFSAELTRVMAKRQENRQKVSEIPVKNFYGGDSVGMYDGN